VGGVDHEVATQVLDATLIGAVSDQQQGLVADERRDGPQVTRGVLDVETDRGAGVAGLADRIRDGGTADRLQHRQVPCVGSDTEEGARVLVGGDHPGVSVEEQGRPDQGVHELSTPGPLAVDLRAAPVVGGAEDVERGAELAPRGGATELHRFVGLGTDPPPDPRGQP
jgi:hypothetical protein